jgi:glucose-6-phosphate isomerase
MKYTSIRTAGHTEDEKARHMRATEYAATMRRAMSDSKYALPEASLRLPFDEVLLKKTQILATKLSGPNLMYILEIGIGGSNLGAKAIYETVSGTLDPHMPVAPKMLFVDTCSPELLSDTAELLLGELSHPQEIIIIIASKSGTTTETIINASVLVSALETKFGSLAERIVCITDEESPLWLVAKKHGFHVLPVPHMVGGRYSVFSPAGIVPLACAGVEVDLLLRGAQSIVQDCVERGGESEAFLWAEDIFNAHAEGRVIFDLFLFHPEMESFGKWYRQLFAESMGKGTTVDGLPSVHRMVPTVSVGSTDLHSVEQMNLADPKLSFRTLVRAHAPHWEHQFLASDTVFAPLVPGVSHRAPCEILDAIYKGLRETYHVRGVLYGEIALESLDPESLGALLQFHMCMVMHLADMFRINAFDQPNVEEYKTAVRKVLDGQNSK